MEAGVPFALLGAVQLLLVTAWATLGGAALAMRRGRRGATLVTAGSVVLLAVEIRTALSFGTAESDALAFARAAGAVLVGTGLYAGALAVSRRRVAVAPAGLAGVVVPLGAAPAPAWIAGACTLAAALAALRARRDLAGSLLAVGLVASAAAAFAAPLADTPDGALTVVGLRGLCAAAVLVGLVLLARRSLLAKVGAAVLGGVLAMSVAAVGVVGTVVVSSFQRQSAVLVENATRDRIANVSRVTDAARIFAPIAARACTVGQCQQALEQFTSGATTGDFVVRVTRDGRTQRLGGRSPLSPSEALGLAQDPTLRAVFASTVRLNEVPTDTVRLVGSPPRLAVVAVALDRPADASSAIVYGVRLDDTYTSNDLDAAGEYGLSFLVGGRIVASNLSAGDRRDLELIAAAAGVRQGLPDSGTTVPAQGAWPTVHFAPVLSAAGQPVGAIAVSRDAGIALAAQRNALRALLVTALLATALVGGLAVLLGRRTVEPVRRLTSAANRVARGDLTVTAAVARPDEVGTLSRTFDAMTGSLARLTDDLRASAARLQTVLTSMSDGLVATDAEGLVTSINPAALAMVGLASADEAVGRPLADVVDVRDAAGTALAVPSVRLLDAAGEVHRPGSEQTVPVRVALAPLDSGDGVVLVLRDMTREREIERMKTEFLSNVSHELRTPLTPIRGYAEILLARPDLDPAKVAAFATTIRDESLRMGRVVDLLVDVAAIEAGRVSVDPRPVAVQDLVDGRLAAWREKVPDRAADLTRRLATGLPAVMVDPTWVGKALDELIDNAVKYTAPGTAITLAAARDGDAVRVAVRDAGPGIAEHDQRTLFTSFEQVDGSATRRVGGLGLGLSFVRRLAEQAGFPLSFTSTLGRGSEFALALPVSDQPVPAVSRASRATRPPVPARDRAR
jgi:two-component system phosphate regulon sensor histidine kinase PhoR